MEEQKQAPGKYGRQNRASRRKKRKYYGNQATHPAKSVPEASDEFVDIHTEEVVSASRKKLKLDPTEDTPPVSADKFIDCNIIINITLMIEFFENYANVPTVERK